MDASTYRKLVLAVLKMHRDGLQINEDSDTSYIKGKIDGITTAMEILENRLLVEVRECQQQ